MSTEPFIGEVKIFGFDWAPRGYMLCAGQLLPISANAALFSLIGTTYGGNGIQTFALPDLRGRMPIGQGQGPGLPDYVIGQMAGTTQVTLTTANMPAHVHDGSMLQVRLPVSTAQADEISPQNAYLAPTGSEMFTTSPSAGAFYGPSAIGGTTGISGANIPMGIMNPYLAMNYSIAITGIFPSRP